MRQLINVAVPPKLLNSLCSTEPIWNLKPNTDGSVDLFLYDGIGDPEGSSTAADVVNFLAKNKTRPVNARFNSVGGLAWDGIAIHNAFAQHEAPVTSTIEGVAASAAAVAAVGSQKVRMVANANMMVHRALCMVVGNVDDMADMMDLLNKIDDQIAQTLGAKAGKNRTHMMALMKGKVDGTYMNAKEAKDIGLIDEIVPVRDKAKNDYGIDPEDEVVAVGGEEAVREQIQAKLDREREVRVRMRLMEMGAR
jgi:ATP-dependent protease ClpP protease subunit